MHKNSFDWALQLLTNETIQTMASLKTHMPHSAEGNVREDSTPAWEGSWEEHRTGQLQEVGTRLLWEGKHKQNQKEITQQVGSTGMASKLCVFLREDEKQQASALLGIRSPGDILLGKVDILTGKKNMLSFLKEHFWITAPPCWLTCGCTSSLPPQRQTLHSCTPQYRGSARSPRSAAHWQEPWWRQQVSHAEQKHHLQEKLDFHGAQTPQNSIILLVRSTSAVLQHPILCHCFAAWHRCTHHKCAGRWCRNKQSTYACGMSCTADTPAANRGFIFKWPDF